MPGKVCKSPTASGTMEGKENARKGANSTKRKAPNAALQAHSNGEHEAAGVTKPDVAAANKKPKVNGVNGAINSTASPAEAQTNGRTSRQTNKVDYREQKAGRTTGSARLAVREDVTATSEEEALAQTGGAASTRCKRRLLDFDIADAQHTRQPLEGADLSAHALFLTGVVQPISGKVAKENGRRVTKVGPVTSWSIDFASSTPQVVVCTSRADYAVSKPAAAYKAIAEHLLEAVGIAVLCYKAVVPSAGGSSDASLAEVVAKLVRAKAGKSYSSPKEALLLNAKFVAAQLCAKDKQLAESAFIKAMVREARQHAKLQQMESTGMKICEPTANGGSSSSAAATADEPAIEQMELDEDFARQLQAKLNAEEARRGQNGGARRPTSGKAYIKVHESEIADDYPEPAQYTPDGEEMDELLLFGEDEDVGLVDPEHLPRRLLKNFTIYNAEGFMASLELLPMWSGVDPDVDLFASGIVLDDDGEWSGGQTLDAANDAAGGSGAASGPGAAAEQGAEPGMKVFLSQIREWVVDFSADMLFISLRTDVAWYRLSTPADKYVGWFNTVLKSARLAVSILQMLSEEARASRLSFKDIIKRLAQQPENSPTFISKRVAAVERFVVVHAQILLNQFAHFPNKAIKSSAFASSLRAALETRRHHKLYATTARAVRRTGVNRNPMRNSSGPNRQKPMAATATAMVKAIWQSYFAVGGALTSDDAAKAAAAEDAPAAREVEEDENEEEEEGEAAEVENALAAPSGKKSAKPAKVKAPSVEVAWIGSSIGGASGANMYRKAKVGSTEVAVGDVVALTADDDAPEELASSGAPLGLVQAMWQTPSGGQKVQLRGMLRGADTVLGDAASDVELFLTDTLLTRRMQQVTEKVTAERRQQQWGHNQRRSQCAADAARRERNAAAVAAGNPAAVEHVFSKLYLPHRGMFADAPTDLQLGTRLPESEEEEEGLLVADSGDSFRLDGVQYAAGDYVFLLPDVFDQMPEATVDDREAVPDFAANSRHVKGGANAGLRAYGIGKIVRLAADKGGKKAAAAGGKLTVQRLYRPEDISRELAYTAAFTDVYESTEEVAVSLDDVVAKCSVLPAGSTLSDPTVVNAFVVAGSFNRKTKKVLPPKEAGKGKANGALHAAASTTSRWSHREDDGVALATLDIFAGCGGLSEGLAQAGAAISKWAIEYEAPAADAFRLNHPEAATFCANCNVILARAMANAGASDDCDASEEAREQAAAMEEETAGKLPLPGQVAMIVGGPPCQGYSGMNRFNKGNWSMVQNSMVMSYLSFADFYRPRYFLLENVRNFVSHNKSFTFRLTLRSLLDMGYQVRFGVLNAGNFGVAQSRKRTIILAAAPGETLPEWPSPAYVFSSPQLTINLPGGVAYTAVPAAPAAPRRAVTVRDAIGDLPPIENGANVEEMPYAGQPQSDFQRAMRQGAEVLIDHVSKEMNEINLERCRCIPTNTPGADWRCLEAIVKADPSREKYKGQALVPWCLPNTAERHNGWRGLFGRLDWRGHFPTSTTDPQPMGKVGQVFHPDQNRIISVRECARAQGFPDTFRFAGNVHAKHRQIGNAVPPPLAAAIGHQLRKVLDGKAQADVQKSMEAALAAL